MKVALLHDHLNQLGGAEKVLQAFTQIYPGAPVYTLVHDPKSTKGFFKNLDVKTSFIERLPGGRRHFKWYLPLMPMAVESFDLSDYDLVLSDCSAMIKGVITRPDSIHICYCHTPTRYLWSDTHRYVRELNQPALVKKMLPHYLNKLRIWDRIAADRVEKYIANSEFVKKRIRKYYQRDSQVIHPPVDVSSFKISDHFENFYLLVSRLRPYKEVDLAIEAFNHLKIPLKIVGTGEEEAKLKKMAGPTIEFLGDVPDHQLKDLYSRCKAFINPQEEDFGITAVEAMAAGRPVIAYRSGGATESVVENVTGMF
ncbi:glycosyltransferase, partial [Patescibacteria group bacterium]|nr:glycosyltransferase [Patescibacteria group bacterium]